MKEVDVAAAQREYEFTHQTYIRAGAAGRFTVSGTDGDSNMADAYLRLLG